MPRTVILGACLSLLLGVAIGCQQSNEQAAVTIPTPQMPSDWKIVKDFLVTDAELEGFSSKMNAKLIGARNTAYDVGGLRIQVNTLVAASPTDAEHVMDYMKSIKSEQALVQAGTTVYELVGTSEVNHLIPLAREHLSKASM